MKTTNRKEKQTQKWLRKTLWNTALMWPLISIPFYNRYFLSLVGFSDFFLMNILWQRGCDSFLKVGCWKSMTSFLAALCHSLLCSLLEKPASLFRSALWGVPWGTEGMSHWYGEPCPATSYWSELLLPPLNLEMATVPASSAFAAPRETLSQRHSVNLCCDSWPIEPFWELMFVILSC